MPLYERALRIREGLREGAGAAAEIGLATSLNEIASLHQAMGTHKLALPLYQRALGIYEVQQGP